MNSKSTTWIVCRDASQKGKINFYMVSGGRSYYLFTQKFRHSIWEFFRNGVRFEKALDYGKAKHDAAIINVMQRIRRHINYMMRTENVEIPEIRNQFAA